MIENNPNEISTFLKVIISLKDILLGLIGGFVVYLFDYSKARRGGDEFTFKWTSLLINIILGGYVGFVVGGLIPTDLWWRDAVISMCGVSSYKILEVAQARFGDIVLDKISNLFKGK